MFLTSSVKPIDPQLQESVDEIEEKSTGVSVLTARQCYYQLTQIPLEVTLTTPERLNPLEEFILRAGLEFDTPPTADELATVLKVDPIFLHTTISHLQTLNILENSPDQPIQLTSQGRQFYQQRPVSQRPEFKQIYAICDPLSERIQFQSSMASEVDDSQFQDLSNLENLVPIKDRFFDVSSLSLEQMQEQLEVSNLGLQVPDQGRTLTSFRELNSPKTLLQTISLFIIFDAVENEIRLEARHEKSVLPESSQILNQMHAEGKIPLQDLCQLTDQQIQQQCEEILHRKHAEVEERINRIREQAQPTSQQSREPLESNTGTVVQLRDREIPKAFNKVLKSAQQKVLIYSPWVNQTVVNQEFLNLLQQLANRGVWIVIGHGIARREQEEERPIPSEVKENLQAIKTSEGLPAVQVCWLGNSHAKEIVVDQKVHLCGSHNWLSYRGDYLPRGESVYEVTIPDQVEEAYQFLSKRFQDYAQKLWEQALVNDDLNLATSALCIWGALGLEGVALEQLENENWLELLPLLFQIICQGLRSQQMMPNSTVIHNAFSLLSNVSENASFIPSLQQDCQKVIGAIALQGHNQAMKLLNSQQIWDNFNRLGIVNSEIDSSQNFIVKSRSQLFV